MALSILSTKKKSARQTELQFPEFLHLFHFGTWPGERIGKECYLSPALHVDHLNLLDFCLVTVRVVTLVHLNKYTLRVQVSISSATLRNCSHNFQEVEHQFLVHLCSFHVDGGVAGNDQLADHAVGGAVQQRLQLASCLPGQPRWKSCSRDLVHHVPGHACPGAAAAGHVRPAPGVPRDAGGPWWRWLTTALQKYQGSVFISACVWKSHLQQHNILKFSGGQTAPLSGSRWHWASAFLTLAWLARGALQRFFLPFIIIILLYFCWGGGGSLFWSCRQ